MRDDLIHGLVLAWIRDDWKTYNETLADMTAYELRESARILHLMARSMDITFHMREMDVEQER